MKKFLSTAILLYFFSMVFCVPVFAKFGTQSFGSGRFGTGAFNGEFGESGGSLTLLQQLQSYPNLTFYKNFSTSQSNANADYSVGSVTATFVSARGGSAPAVYFDAAGAITITTTANVPRFTQGYYDETGFHLCPGLLIETGGGTSGVGVNRALQSRAFTNAAWTKTNITASDAESGLPILATASSLTASATDGTLTQAFTDGVAGIWSASIFIKRKTGTGTISLRANTSDAYTDITAFVGTSWTRVQAQSSSLTNPTFDLKISTNGDAVYVYGAQLEKFPYATSFIPNTASATTRPHEVLSYVITGNRTVAAESAFIKFRPLGKSFANDNQQRTLFDTQTKERLLRKANTSSIIRMIPNNTDSSSVLASGALPHTVGTSYVSAGVIRHDPTPWPYVELYDAGVFDASYTTGDWTDPAWGTNFYVGNNGTTSELNGIIEIVAIYGSAFEYPEVNRISAALDSNVTPRSYVLTPSITSSSNLVSGSAGNGNVATQTQYMWHDEYACADTGWTKETQTCEDVLLFHTTGSDAQLTAGVTQPTGDILMRHYTKSTNTMSASPATIWTDATYYTAGLWVQRNAGESFLRVYFMKFPRADGGYLNQYPALFMMKSTDLTGATWGTPVAVTSSAYGIFSGFLDTANPSVKIFPLIDGSNNKVTFLSTSDGGDTFNPIPYSSINYTLGAEGRCVNENGGARVICVFRKNSGDYLLQTVSSDYGLTWTPLFSTGMGAATGAKVVPVLIQSAGMPDYVTAYFYDRGDNRLKISSPTLFSNAYAGHWATEYLIGTASQGNGGIFAIDATKHQYIVSTNKENLPNTDMNWWKFKDIFTWVPQ